MAYAKDVGSPSSVIIPDSFDKRLDSSSNIRWRKTKSETIAGSGESDSDSSMLTINKGGETLTIDFDGASATDITSSLMDNLSHLKD